MMDVALAATNMDTYEDMFKEITRKLYGDEAEAEGLSGEGPGAMLRSLAADYEDSGALAAFGLAALMHQQQQQQHQGNPDRAWDRWLPSDEPLPAWAGGSRVAAYNPSQKLFRCADCGCVGFLARVAEHWLGSHAHLRAFQCPQCPYSSAWARCVRTHLTRQHGVAPADADAALFAHNPVLEEVTKFLHRLKARAEAATAAAAAAVAVRPPPPLLVPQACPPQPPQQPPQQPQQQPQQQQAPPQQQETAAPAKRYCCGYCPYATDRRDLFTRHENIHRAEKPFQCYVCQKQFNRADHVKKHFLRMHRDYPYDLNRVRRSGAKSPPPTGRISVPPLPQQPPAAPPQSFFDQGAARQAHRPLTVPPPPPPVHHPPPPPPLHALGGAAGFPPPVVRPPHFTPAAPPPPPDCGGLKRGGGGCDAKSHVSKAKKKGAVEKRFACCYCSWSGVDNWCLKRHLNTHLKPFVCALCDYKAARSERLATHVLKVHNKRSCGKCSFLADDQAQLTIHRQEHHQHQSAASSNHFGLVKREQHHFELHNYGHRAAPKQQHCGAARLFHYMEASDTSDQEDEVETGTGDPPEEEGNENSPTVCRRCGCEFVDSGSLQTHILIHHGAQDASSPKAVKQKVCAKSLPYQCTVCQCSLSSQSAMLEHMRVHNGRLHCCKVVGCTFSTLLGEETLEEHSKVHQSIPDNCTVQCPHCKQELLTESAVKQHIPQHHLPDSICNMCDDAFKKPLLTSISQCFNDGYVNIKYSADEKLETENSLQSNGDDKIDDKSQGGLPGSKRSRKQRQPRRVVTRDEDYSEIQVMQLTGTKLRQPKRNVYGRNSPLSHLREKYMSSLLSRKRLRCSWCLHQTPLFPYHTPISLSLHYAWRHRIKKFRCEHCDEKFYHQYQVVIHSSREHANAREDTGVGSKVNPSEIVTETSTPLTPVQKQIILNTPQCSLPQPPFINTNVPDALSESVSVPSQGLGLSETIINKHTYTKPSILNIPLPPPIMATSSSHM